MRIFLCLLLILPACRSTYVNVPKAGLPAFVHPDNGKLPRISAHRGGGGYAGYPENCLASFQYLIEQAPMFIECDVRISADSVLLLMHDRDLDRTTTGTGRVNEQPWALLDTMHLLDNLGNQTPHEIPRLDEALRWAKGKAILTLDVKRGVPYELVVAAVQRAKAQRYAAIITYSAKAAAEVYALDSTLAISVGIRSAEDRQRLLDLGLDPDNLIAFTGTSLCDPAVYADNRALGIPNLLGTLGNLDRQAVAKGDSLYLRWLDLGVDVIATDRPVEVAQMLGTKK
jgi:glycerophosphoryl diester phosphodiesterase